MSKPDLELIALMDACVVHARSLVDSASAVEAIGRYNIAYHLAALALEELGKSKLYEISHVASRIGDPPSWHTKATQDHTRKIFWCLFSMRDVRNVSDQAQFFALKEAAENIHAKRLSGLYVEKSDNGFSIPSELVTREQARGLIRLAEVYVSYAESAQPRDEIPADELDLQLWFLEVSGDPDRRNYIFNQRSIARLKELNDVGIWVSELRASMLATNEEMVSLARREIGRSPDSYGTGEKDRWKLQLKLRTHSNSIRPKPLKKWNEKIRWIKLSPQQGAKSKEELLIEMVLGDNVPIHSVVSIGMSLAIRLVIALNVATGGFWWWLGSPNQRKFYDRIHDLEHGVDAQIEDSSFHVFDRRPELTDIHIENALRCFMTIPDPEDPRSAGYTHYLGGLNFLALNCFHWRCEMQAYGNFFEATKCFIRDASFQRDGEEITAAVCRFVFEKYPSLDVTEFDEFSRRVTSFEERRTETTATLGQVYFMKLLCETLMREVIIPEQIKRLSV